jgi:hypothetical protein
MSNLTGTRSVTVGREFYKKELAVYGQWREAFARELFQNSLDAKASRIDVTFEDLEGFGRVTFTDEGEGMSLATLTSVYFSLGATTKQGTDTLGGFGRARLITCFAQLNYTIRTGNLLVEGSGGEYSISEVSDFQSGCVFTIDLIDADTDRIKNAFRELLRQSSLRIPVTLDGRPAPTRTMPARANRVMRDDNGNAWAQVYATTDRYGEMLVRVHGLVMFRRWLSGNEDVVLELTLARSREVLSASRDQLRAEYGDQIDRFVADLAGNRRKALAPADVPLEVHVGGGGFMATDSKVISDDEAVAEPEDHAQSGTDDVDNVVAKPVTGGGVTLRPANVAAFTNFGQATLAIGSDWTPAPRNNVGFDVFMIADSSDARVKKLARAWDPTGWDERTGKRRRALLMAWKEAISIGLDALVAYNKDLGRVMWTVGWVFDSGTHALHRSQGEGHVLALNPVDETGATRFHTSQRNSRQRLLALALHEVAHVVIDTHDERFAGLLTELMATVDQVDADRRIRAASSTT